MESLETLQSQLTQLRLRRAQGLRSAAYGDTKVEYSSDAEMAAAITDLERRIAALTPAPKMIRIIPTKGL